MRLVAVSRGAAVSLVPIDSVGGEIASKSTTLGWNVKTKSIVIDTSQVVLVVVVVVLVEVVPVVVVVVSRVPRCKAERWKMIENGF